MAKYNAENERVKRRYFTYLKEADRNAAVTVDAAANAIYRFETYTKFKSLKAFHINQAIGFKKMLAERISNKTGKKLSKATVYSILRAMKHFIHWLAGQPGYKSRISYSDSDYFNLTEKEMREAGSARPKRIPTPEQIETVLDTMQNATVLHKRDRALIAFIAQTGARDGAVIGLRIGDVDLERSCVHFDPRYVNTKFSKTFTTFFVPLSPAIRAALDDWIKLQREVLGWGDTDPLFPSTEMVLGPDRKLQPAGIKREHWKSAAPIRRIFKTGFERARLPYCHPHTCRDMLVQVGYNRCKTPEQMKAWSQNLGHAKMSTTLMSYGTVPQSRQAEIIVRSGDTSDDEAGLLMKIREMVSTYQARTHDQ